MRISDWSSDVCSSDLLYRSQQQILNRLRHPMNFIDEKSGSFAGFSKHLGFCKDRLQLRHIGRDSGDRFEAEASGVREKPSDRRLDRKRTRMNYSHQCASRMPSPASKNTIYTKQYHSTDSN